MPKNNNKSKKPKISIGGITAKTTLANKTGAWRSKRPEVTDKCAGCGVCVEYCPEGCIAIQAVKGKRKAVIDYTYCKGCMICASVCPIKAVIEKQEK
ncbi:MAG: 4Fe-4S binding protein [Candidatus Aenigmarchaeota archaeon]|nr:4Fe-4S binding protein [Candidatus Aenigmarchaeota archaeon]